MRRWPAWRLGRRARRAVPGRTPGSPTRRAATTAHRRLARERGATLRDRTRVVALEDADDGEVDARARGRRAPSPPGRVILAADAWTNDLLAPLGWPLPLTVTQEQVALVHAARRPAAVRARAVPGLDLDGRAVVLRLPDPRPPGTEDRAGRRRPRGDPGDPHVRARRGRPGPGHWRSSSAHLPGMAGEPFLIKTCLYTLTPDRDFVVDAVPGHPRRPVLLQGAAHAYKFASVLGRIIVELAVDGVDAVRIRSSQAFRIDRPLLRDPGPRRPASSSEPLSRSRCAVRHGTPVATSAHRCATLRADPPPGDGVAAAREAAGGGPASSRRRPDVPAPARARAGWSHRRSLLLALRAAACRAPAIAVEGDEPVVLRVGTTQDLDASNPFNTDARRRLRGVPAHLRPAGQLRQGRQARARASPTPGSARPTR